MRKSKRSLENPLLYARFIRAIRENNPDLEIDPEYIDRQLEYDEAFAVLQGVYPGIRLSRHTHNELEEYRDYLCDAFAVCEKSVQNAIIQDLNQPFTELDLQSISGALNTRSERGLKLDKARKAPITKDIRKYSKYPNRLDFRGVDTGG